MYSGTAKATETPIRAGDVMSSRVISIAPEATVLQAIELLLDIQFSGLPVSTARVRWSGYSLKATFCAARR